MAYRCIRTYTHAHATTQHSTHTTHTTPTLALGLPVEESAQRFSHAYKQHGHTHTAQHSPHTTRKTHTARAGVCTEHPHSPAISEEEEGRSAHNIHITPCRTSLSSERALCVRACTQHIQRMHNPSPQHVCWFYMKRAAKAATTTAATLAVSDELALQKYCV